MQALTVYRLFFSNSERTLTDISERPQVSREVEYYQQRIEEIDSAEELVSDTRVMNFIMRAYGMEELSYAKALVRSRAQVRFPQLAAAGDGELLPHIAQVSGVPLDRVQTAFAEPKADVPPYQFVAIIQDLQTLRQSL